MSSDERDKRGKKGEMQAKLRGMARGEGGTQGANSDN